ncbi:hypothetical protein EX30DRAFT_270950 [Ascodesmis nigricans]|uniref:Uncharacterized protein n=1 Tax=Ascodesmis nigricans TaxID=341454 RepID=A0A4S2MX39_9PEZI|nr:hypothetical protein EX30DRAFT_270950 [Ascodesmis nigricans]
MEERASGRGGRGGERGTSVRHPRRTASDVAVGGIFFSRRHGGENCVTANAVEEKGGGEEESCRGRGGCRVAGCLPKESQTAGQESGYSAIRMQQRRPGPLSLALSEEGSRGLYGLQQCADLKGRSLSVYLSLSHTRTLSHSHTDRSRVARVVTTLGGMRCSGAVVVVVMVVVVVVVGG